MYTGAVQILEKQLKAYLEGILSRPSAIMIEQTDCAPLHNIFAEQTLGLTDHQFRRAPNAIVGFIDGKVRCKKNHTLSWLESKLSEEQEQIVLFTISHAATGRKLRKDRDELISKKKKQTQLEKQRKRVHRERTRTERDLNQVVDGSVHVSQMFPEIDVPSTELIDSLVSSPGSFVGKYVNHVWEGGEGEDVQYHGKVLKFKVYSNIGPAFIISYWGLLEEEKDSVDFKLKLREIVLDILKGDFELA